MLCKTLEIRAPRRGLHMITDQVREALGEHVDNGVCHLFICHTSASLCIQENADPSARGDLERFFDHLVPENMPFYQHVHEGPDDMPSHIKSVLSDTQLTIPVRNHRLALGTWQGIYLWEHRDRPTVRRIQLSAWG